MKHFFFLAFLLLIYSCERDKLMEPNVEEPTEGVFVPEYSFFVAGHVYGHPTDTQVGMHPPFVQQIPFINNYADIRLGVLTGDVVRSSNQAYWDTVRTELEEFSMPIHIAAGNHDRGDIFESLYPYYYSFWEKEDLFIILSPTDWNIENEQKDFLLETIENSASMANNIFIFCHELIWWAPDNEFGNIKINYAPHYPGSTNYWSEISPILKSISKNVVIFAGDLGAKADVDPYMYYKYDNITLIANGMGGGVEDNVIIIEVDIHGQLRYKLLGINEEVPYELGILEEFELP